MIDMLINKPIRILSLITLAVSFIFQLSLLAIPMQSQAAVCDKSSSDFGNFEVGIPGLSNKGTPICFFITKGSGGSPFLKLMSAIINVVTVLTVIAGLIMIIVGAYFIMLAGGDSSRTAMGKTFIKSALLGIVLALTAYLILNTISGQYASNLKEPHLPDPNGAGEDWQGVGGSFDLKKSQ